MAQPRPHDRQGRTRMPSLGDLDTSNLDDYAPMQSDTWDKGRGAVHVGPYACVQDDVVTTHGAKRSGRVRVAEVARECGWLRTTGSLDVYRRGPLVVLVRFTATGAVKWAARSRESSSARQAVDRRVAPPQRKAEWVIEQLSRMGDA